jgi:chemotaxis protein MotB
MWAFGTRRAELGCMHTLFNPRPVLVLALTSFGCVPTGKYDAALQDAQRAHAALNAQRSASQRALDAREADLGQLRRRLEDTDARCSATNSELEATKNTARTCGKALDDATAMNQSLRSELELRGKNVDQLLSARGALASSLEQAKARLDELRRAQAAADARAAQFKDIALRLRRMVDTGDLRISLRSGRMVLALPTDVLFDSGRAKIKPRGREALTQVGSVLTTIAGRRFQVAGHTDNEPIRLSGFSSNWQLSSERALEVVNVLIESGMRPETLSAAGYGEFDPLSPNDTAENKAHNRRIEITLQPNIDEIVSVPESR